MIQVHMGLNPCRFKSCLVHHSVGGSMKKIFTVLVIMLLCACSGKLSWDDVKDHYAELQNAADDFNDQTTVFLKNDYMSLLGKLEEYVNELESGIGADESETADALFDLAAKLDRIAGLFKGDAASQLMAIANDAKDLVKAAYEKSDQFDSLKEKLLEAIDNVKEWADDQWYSVEKKQTIVWDAVEEDYAAMAEEVIENMPSRRKVTEAELEQLNETITNNYETIRYGVTVENEDIAREIYSAGLQFSEYTENISGNTPEKVHDFGQQTMQYVIECYGGPVTLENYDFLNQVQSAKKWSLSLWNELTAILKK